MHDRVTAKHVGRAISTLAILATIQLAAPSAASPPDTRPSTPSPRAAAPDITSDLSAERAAVVRDELESAGPARREEAIGRIEIPRVGVSALVLDGVDDATIRRAVGHFPETPAMGVVGNVALAAHRTTDFFGLRHIRHGDLITLTSAQGRTTYQVDALWVVKPQDVWVLEPTHDRSLTLVTCFPFDYRGHAPERFIVRAHAVDRATGAT